MATRHDREYGNAHRKLRRRWQHAVTAGRATCARCRQTIEPSDDWELDHTDDRTGYLGPSHATCNRRHGADVTNGKRATTVRDW